MRCLCSEINNLSNRSCISAIVLGSIVAAMTLLGYASGIQGLMLIAGLAGGIAWAANGITMRRRMSAKADVGMVKTEVLLGPASKDGMFLMETIDE